MLYSDHPHPAGTDVKTWKSKILPKEIKKKLKTLLYLTLHTHK